MSTEALLQLEQMILDEGDQMSAEKARNCYDELVSMKKLFTDFWKEQFDSPKIRIVTSECVDQIDQKIIQLQEYLRRFFEPIDEPASSKKSMVKNSAEQNNSDRLDSLLKKQKFHIKMIDLLKPGGEISSRKAKLQYTHLSLFYEYFVSNQGELMMMVKDTQFDDQVKISKEIQRKVISFQETLKEISLPNKLAALPESKVNDNRTECPKSPKLIVDLLDSLRQKQKIFIEEIKIINSKNDIDAVGAEMLLNHLTQLYESFVENQAEIEANVESSELNKELKISLEILEEVMSFQMKARIIVAPVASPSLDRFILDVKSEISKFYKFTMLNLVVFFLLILFLYVAFLKLSC